MKPLIVKESDLPLTIVLEGSDGQREVYQLTKASRKFGAFLQKLIGQIREAVLASLIKNNR